MRKTRSLDPKMARKIFFAIRNGDEDKTGKDATLCGRCQLRRGCRMHKRVVGYHGKPGILDCIHNGRCWE